MSYHQGLFGLDAAKIFSFSNHLLNIHQQRGFSLIVELDLLQKKVGEKNGGWTQCIFVQEISPETIFGILLFSLVLSSLFI